MTVRCPWFFFFQAEDGIRDVAVTGVQTCALPICAGVRVLALAQQAGGGPQPLGALRNRPASPVARRPVGALENPLERVGRGLRERLEDVAGGGRSEERREGKEGRSRWSAYHLKKKKESVR